MNRTFFTVILLCSALGVGIFLTWPKFQEYSVVAEQSQSKRKELQSREEYFARLREVKEGLAAYADKIAKVDAAVPADSQLPALYDSLQKEASFSGLVLRGLSISPQPGSEAGSAQLRLIPATMNLTGSYGAIKQFLLNIKTASRVASIQSVAFGGDQAGTTFSLSVGLTAYSY
ncbi:MAG: type 4a pilus biogenesis protein PilO [Candidatus Wildermuthbacteria bacterium]|nr:type 4a pilus biogenesis protein PilO [Candidatus Wildermuthbacteria bacterium]